MAFTLAIVCPAMLYTVVLRLPAGLIDATTALETLVRLLDEARPGGSRRVGRGDLALGRALLARGEADAARAAITRAIDELESGVSADLLAQARAALAD